MYTRMVKVKLDRILEVIREQDELDTDNLFPILSDSMIFALHESETGISNEFGTGETPSSTIIDNLGNLVWV